MSEDLRDLVERHLAGVLSPEEEAALARRLRTDDDAVRDARAQGRAAL